MSLAKLKIDIIKEICEIDHISVLEDIQHSIADYKAGIIGYRMDGTPVGVEEFRKQAGEALERVKNGAFFTVEQLREQRKQLLENKKNSKTAP